MYGATIGKLGILSFPATTNQACCACIEYPAVEQMFLFYFLFAHKDDFIRLGGGGAQPNISKDIIVKTAIPIPPKKEQQRIVSEIQKYFNLIDLIDSGESLIAQSISNFKAKILSLAISGKLVSQDPSDEPALELLKRINPDFKPCDNSHYENLLPDGWCLAYLGDVAEYGDTANVDIASISPDSWILELEDIEKDSAKILCRKTKAERDINGVRHSFKAGQILYSKLRTYLNKVLIAPKDGFCTTEIVPITAGAVITPDYLLAVLRSPYFLDYTKSCGYGVKMPRLGTSDAKKAFIPIPPLPGQHRIAKAISDLQVTLNYLSEGLK